MGCANQFSTAAHEYVEKGLAVIPLHPGKKEPATLHGTKDWTDNPGQVDFWWGQGEYAGHPKSDQMRNVGIVCGQVSGGVIAIDLDVHDAGHDGTAFLRDWEVEHGRLPETWTQITGSGGRQMLYRTGRDIRNSVNGELGVDVRGEGGYIVAPPSIHPNGEAYEWSVSPDDCDIADADDNVYDFIAAVQPKKQDSNGWRSERVELPDVITENRNDTLFIYGRSLLSRGFRRNEVDTMIRSLNKTNCKPPLPADEVEKLIGSINSKEPGNAEAEAMRGAMSGAALDIRNKRGRLLPNKVAMRMIADDKARIIDGAPAVWTGKRWDFGKKAISRRVIDIAPDASKADCSEVLHYIQHKAPEVSSNADFDGGYYVQFKNCTVEVSEYPPREVVPTPDMFIIAELPIEFDPSEGPNLADEFLASVSGYDADTQTAMQGVMGACICSRRVLSEAPMLIGEAEGKGGKASNGKSTFINWCRVIVGEGNYTSMDISTLGQRFNAGQVVGKLANLGDDIPNGPINGQELSTFKKLVTGDSIYTDVKGSDGFYFKPSATFVYSMNSMPRLGDITDGVFRRLAFVPFRNKFYPGTEGYDPDIARKLARPEVLRRGAILGLMELPNMIKAGVLHRIPDMADRVEEVKRVNDSIADWLHEEDVGVEDIHEMPSHDVYRKYKLWCDMSGRRAVSEKSFTGSLNDDAYLIRGIDGRRLIKDRKMKDGVQAMRFFIE